MGELETERKRPLTVITVIVRWVLGIIFFLAYFCALIEHQFLASMFLFLVFIVLVPPISQIIEGKLNLSISGILRFILVFCLLIGFAIAIPNHTSSDSNVQSTSTISSSSTLEKAAFEVQLVDEIQSETGLSVDSSDIDYNITTKSISVELHASTDLGSEKYRKGIIHQTFEVMSVLVKHPSQIYIISFYSRLPTIDIHGNKELTVVYSAITTMDDAKNVNWKNLEDYPDYTAALNSNFAASFSNGVLQ